MRVLLGLVVVIAACSSATSDGDEPSPEAAADAGGARDSAAGAPAGGEDEDGGEDAAAGRGGAPGGGAATGHAGADGGEPPDGSAGADAGNGGAPGAPSSTPGGSGGTGGSGVSCTSRTFYADTDRDGFGDPATKVTACVSPQWHVENSGDCDDTNPKARPGQLEYFKEPRANGSYDYDCNGSEELRYTKFSECPELDNSCPPPNRWPEGFTCDYAGMIAPYSSAETGWRQYRSLVSCTWEECVYAPATIPACGLVGRAGKPPIYWSTETETYSCDDWPWLSDHDIGFLEKRTQSCH